MELDLLKMLKAAVKSVQNRNINPDSRTRSQFQYESLQHDFRLAKLFPGAASIEVELFSCDFKNAPSYEIVTYVWPDLPLKFEILCNENTFEINQNLFQALISIRSELSPGETRYLWTDQICINQSDPAERSQQFVLMRKILTSASRTTLWVGDPDGHNSELAFELLSELGVVRDQIFADGGSEFLLSSSDHLQVRGQLLRMYRSLLASQEPQSWKALDELLDRRPFHR
jgi:hypothetical protein